MGSFIKKKGPWALLFFLILLAPPAFSAPAKNGACHRLVTGLSQYLGEAIRTKGRSLVLTPAPADSLDETSGEKALWGVLYPSYNQPRGISRALIQGLPRLTTFLALGRSYDFRPFHSANEKWVKPGTRVLTKNWKGGPYEMARTLTFAVSMAASLAGFQYYDHVTHHLTMQHEMATIEKDGGFYDKLIEKDIRFEELKTMVQGMNFTSQQRHALAARLREIQLEYFEYMNGTFLTKYDQDPLVANLEILRQPTFGALYFKDIKSLYESGVPENLPTFNYLPGFQKKVSSEQLDLLMKNKHLALYRYEMARVVAQSSKTLTEMETDPDVQYYFGDSSSWPFVSELLTKMRQSQVSQENVEQALQKYAFYAERLERYSILHLALKAGDPADTGKIVTIEQIQSQILAELDIHKSS